MCSLLVPKSVFFPCPSPFRRPNLKFFPFRLVNRSLFALVHLCILVFLKYLTRQKPRPQAPPFFSEDEHSSPLFQSPFSMFSPAHSKSSKSLFTQSAAMDTSAAFMAVYFGFEMQPAGGFSFQWRRSQVEFRSVARGYSESQNCTKYSEGKILKSRNKHES
jgi:hypothetical protein